MYGTPLVIGRVVKARRLVVPDAIANQGLGNNRAVVVESPERMPSISIQIVRFVDEHQPGFVECRLVDAQGNIHHFIEKVPVVTRQSLRCDSSYPQLGTIGCEVEAEWTDEFGHHLLRVSTEKPWGVESTIGATRFVVFSSQVMRA